MQIGIVGLAFSGKTTLFNLMTSVNAPTGFTDKERVNVGVSKVPDERVDYLSSVYSPKKTTHATIEFTDIAGLVPGQMERSELNQFLNSVRRADALIYVLRAFDSSEVPSPRDSIDPAADFEDLETEFILADLQIAENVVERLAKNRSRSREEERQLELASACREALSEGRPVRELGLSPDDEALLRGYTFVTQKPVLPVVNVAEEDLKDGSYPGRDRLESMLKPVIFSGPVELDIASLEDEGERREFMAEYGLTDSGVDRITRSAYETLGLISFLTCGEDEVRAWTIKRGTVAKEAAGKIHSDIEKGFIRAEVVAFDDFKASGSMKEARERGLVRLEGKEYVVQDGDIINFRFNVSR